MPRGSGNSAWNLRSFLDSLVVELDKAQDTLAVKAINRPLTYSVKDVALELQIFPTYDGDIVRFTTAQPGQTGASKIQISLGSITDRMIRETAPPPKTADDLTLDDVPDLDEETKMNLNKVGVTSAKDLDRMKRRNIDLKSVAGKSFDYAKLADVINKARRSTAVPRVMAVSLTTDGDILHVRGANLAPMVMADGFPFAAVGNDPAEVVAVSDEEMKIRIDRRHLAEPCDLHIALDPYAVVKMRLKTRMSPDARHKPNT